MLLHTKLSQGTALIADNLIPTTEIEESFSVVLKCKTFSPSTTEDQILRTSGFYNFVRERILGGLFNDYDASNRAKLVVVHYLASEPISKEVAKAIFEGFNTDYHPWHLATALNKLFLDSPAKKQEYLTFVNNLDIKVPEKIKSLGETEQNSYF